MCRSYAWLFKLANDYYDNQIASTCCRHVSNAVIDGEDDVFSMVRWSLFACHINKLQICDLAGDWITHHITDCGYACMYLGCS